MKEYQKPTIEYIDFATEVIADDHMSGDDVSSDVNNPWGQT